ncbi:MAG TPA: phosphate acetyltransferase [Buchnera sp. (in: enterobacteria)]|nr:phosphate acetyltransferase [Buchnera sp. (in: enterobacteria)]
MSRVIMLIPIGSHVGLTTTSIGLMQAITDQNLKVCFFKPIVRYYNNKNTDSTMNVIHKNNSFFCIAPIKLIYTESFFNINYISLLIDKIVSQFYRYKKKYDVVFIEGFRPTEIGILSNVLNYKIALTLNAEIVFLVKETNKMYDLFIECTYFLKKVFKEERYLKVSGLIINKINKKIINNVKKFFNMLNNKINLDTLSECSNFYHNKYLFLKVNKLRILAVIPFNAKLIKIPVTHFFQYLNAHIINIGKINFYFIENIILFDKHFFTIMDHRILNSVLIISFEQCQYIKKIYLDKIKNSNIIAILLTSTKEYQYKNTVFFDYFKKTSMTIFSVSLNTLQILSKLNSFNFKVNNTDCIRVKKIKNYICRDWLSSLCNSLESNTDMSSALFTYNLIKLSSRVKKRIILPEGCDSRIIHAAFICQKKGIADCILLGDPKAIHNIALKEGIILNKNNNIIDPKIIRNNYITRLVDLRSHKGMTIVHAKEMVKDNVILATLMLENNDVDGMVSGAINTTANTIRPALQLIKMKKTVSLVSSLFFMLLSNTILIYADCAINVVPNADELADIAIQSADSAKLFGIDPRIAMISYSTYESGFGCTVDKVRRATYIVKKRRPDLIIDGPLQYDAATIPEVAIVKAPKSCISGCANILIFPDLNTGNTVYKAVQRLAKVVAVGPILQGLNKPVNDLSRGATIEDIIYTIAITTIQSI